MQLMIDRTTLLRPLGHVQSVIERRNTIPILLNVMLQAQGGGLDLTATDMDLQIVESVGCNVAADGAVTISAQTLYDIVRKLPEGSEIRLEQDEENAQVLVTAGRATFRLPSLPSGDFPKMPNQDLPYRFVLQAADFRSIIDRTRFAIANEETRRYLNGIFLHATQVGEVPVMRVVATDGHRMARVEIPLPDGAGNMPGVIVPRKAVGEFRKLLDDTDGEVTVSLSDNMLTCDCGASVLTTKLIEGTFPEYNRVIPAGNDRVMLINSKALADAVDRVSTVASERNRSVKLELTDGNLVLSASSQEGGTAQEEVEVSYGDDAMEIGFNARYLLDIVNQVDGDGTVFQLADSGSPAIVRDADDESSLYILMPMRV